MKRDTFLSALASLRGDRADDLDAGIARLQGQLSSLDDTSYRQAVEALSSLFFLDTHERPELEPRLDDAARVIAESGERAVHPLLDALQGSDIRSHLHLAKTLGYVGAAALPALRRVVATDEDPYVRTFALLALGKITDPSLRQAIPEMIGALEHPEKEVRDSAARALGKVADVVPAYALSAEHKADVFEALFRALSDAQPGVRAKAVRSLGKMSRAGFLTLEQALHVESAIGAILGEDERHEWDRAFIVRREAVEARRQLETSARRTG
jgi:hypothetical protein